MRITFKKRPEPVDGQSYSRSDLEASRNRHRMTVEQLKTELDIGRELCIIDVREPFELRYGSIPGRQLIPLRTLPETLKQVPGDKDIVVYCHHGYRSAMAVAYLKQKGYRRVRNLTGGIDAWASRVDGAVKLY